MDKEPERKRGRDLDRALRAERRAQLGRPDADRLKRWFGWPLCILGALLFILGYVSSQAGVSVLPFDPHHVVSQAGGLVLAVLGLVWATR